MKTKPLKKFEETNHCTTGMHCRTCRDREAGRYWRLMLAQCYTLPGDEVDFTCPHGKPWGFSETAKRTKPKQDSADGESVGEIGKERHYALPPEVREKLREIFLQFRTACYKQRGLHGCTCELQSMGGCGLKTVLKTRCRLKCAKHHFEDIVIDEELQKNLNKCDNKE